MITQTIRVNLNEKDLETIIAVQSDTLREIAFEFYATDADDAVQLDPDEYTVKFNVLKPDNNFVMTTFTDGVIKLSDQITAVTGTGYYCILLMQDDELIYSGNGKIIINDHVIGSENIDSVSEADGYVFPDDFYTKDTPLAVLDDNTTSTRSTWSSNKINGEINTASTSAISQLNAMKTGFDGVTYESPVAMVQGCDQILENQITDNYTNTGIIKPEKKLTNFAFGSAAFDDTGYQAISGHRYIVVFTQLSSGTKASVGVIVSGTWKGKQDNCAEIATFTATADGKIYLSLTAGTAQTIDDVYIFDTTNNDTLANFITVNKLNSLYMPYGGVSGYLNNKTEDIYYITGRYPQPDATRTSFEVILNTPVNTNYMAVSGHRYIVVFSPLASALATVGVISGGVWVGKQDGASRRATFTATGNGYIFFRLASGSDQTLATLYIYDTTDNDALQSFILTNELDSPNRLFNCAITATWYKGKKFTALGDSVTENASWIPSINKKFEIGTTVNCGVGGTRVSGTASNAFWQDSRVNTIPTDSDFITIMGGTNDGAALVTIGDATRDNHDVSTFIGAYNVLISKVLYKFTSSGSGYYGDVDYTNVDRVSETKPINILLITPGFCGNTTYAGSNYERMETLANATIEVGKLWGIPVCDIYHKAGINPITYPQYLGDSVHPNTAGGKRIASIVIGSMKDTEPVA